ncbi:hypothetical protein [Streptomyces malaysiensis]|uniref:hypothetical protein n=1 Tax=Streptomyces malaysiensis TaxID=92644 RepID=UPI002B29006A|nr:hypothetical protein R8789_08880 [Streptomyces malaysiensis]
MFVDIDSKVKQGYGPAEQGASFGYTKQRGPHLPIVTVKTGTCAAQNIVRTDSAYFSHKVVEVCRRAGTRFSLAVAVRKKVREAIAADAWTPIRYAAAVWDAEEERWISDAEIAEVPFRRLAPPRRLHRQPVRLGPGRPHAPDGHPALIDARTPKKHPEPARHPDQNSRGGSRSQGGRRRAPGVPIAQRSSLRNPGVRFVRERDRDQLTARFPRCATCERLGDDLCVTGR